MNGTPIGANEPRSSRRLLLFAVLMAVALGILFAKSFLPHYVLFANDGPLGAMKAEENRLPEMFAGWWQDLTWVGQQLPSAAPNLSNFINMVLSAEMFLKIYPPFTLFFVGFCAWIFFRTLGFNPMVCLVSGIATALNMHFFSIACWGLGSWNLAFGCIFLAMAALVGKSLRHKWAAAILAGLAVGMNLMEGYDSGAICSVYLGMFILFTCFQDTTASPPKKLLNTVWIGAIVVAISAMFATHTIVSLVGTQVKGISGLGQDQESKQRRWYEATQWSLPKAESLRVIIPGFFGYRMEGLISGPDKSSAYWGHIGRDPHLDEVEKMLKDPNEQVRAQAEAMMNQGYRRHTGSGDYAGVLVAIMALFAIANAFRKNDSPFQPQERRAIWFWTAAAIFSLLASWGRHGFVYQIIYQLPGVSAIRNPIKFLHPFHIAWLILSAYGMEALYRRYLQNAMGRSGLAGWWNKATGFDQKWTLAMWGALAASVLGFIIFVASQKDFQHYLQTEGFSEAAAVQMAKFSFGEIGYFLLFLFLSAGAVTLAMSGTWTGARAKIVWAIFGVILFVDLSHSDVPWIQYFNYDEKYSMNPLTDFLRVKPYEHRMSARRIPNGAYDLPNDNNMGGLIYFWLQNDFPYHNIQSVDIIQMPRMPEIDKAYLQNFYPKKPNDLTITGRLWQLTNTRYIIAHAGFFRLFNEQMKNAFQIRALFNLVPKPGLRQIEDAGDLTIELNQTNGPFALLEYNNALPRVKLYSNWQTPTNDTAALDLLASENFDPTQTLLVSKEDNLAAPKNPTADAGTVTITEYKPKHIKVTANAKNDCVLLYNDKFAPDWHVWVDGKPATLLRCNYIMRGVALEKGDHTIEFKFQPPLDTLYVSLTAWGIGILVAGFLIADGRRKKAGAQTQESAVTKES